MKKIAILFLLFVSVLFSCTNFQEIAGSLTAPELDMSELNVPSNGSDYSLLLTSGAEWDITSKPDWVTVGPITIHTDGDQSAWYKSPKWKVRVSVAGNSDDSRSGSVVFTSASGFAELKVSQESGLPPVVSVKEVKLDKSELTLYEGDSEQLTATVLPEDATDKTVTWSSTDESVATIDQTGLLTAQKAGVATIIVATKDGGKTAMCKVTVLTKVSSVSLNKTELSLYEGDSEQLTATVLPKNASDKSVTWSSGNESVATVDQSGLVRARKAGTATITVTTTDGGKTAACKVTVLAKVSGVQLNKTELSLYEGESEKLTATVLPENAYVKDVVWTSSDESIASVDKSGLVEGLKAGTTTVTATTTDGEKTAACKITVLARVSGVQLNKTELSLSEGDSEQLTATVLPENASDKSVTWSSSDESVATVDQTGMVHAKKVGTATIIVATKDGGRTATCKVTVLTKVIAVTSVTLSPTTLTLTQGESYTLTATVYPSNATDKTVTWSSSNTGVATVSNNGEVTAKSEGSATITALAGGKKATCSVTVKAQVIAVTSITLSPSTLMLMQGESQTLTATVYPSNATDKTVTWSSSNTGVATVSNNGVVTAKSEGSATITALAGGKTGTCSVTVTHPSSGPEAIDLGLSVKWASCNVGARSPEEYGDYFAWGETEPKSDSYSWETYKWCNGSANTLIKYNNNSGYGAVDNKTVLDSSDDAARANWGGSWRMPTDAEWTELFRNCTWTWTSQNGVMGIKVTGPNRKSIFLPAAGDRAGTYLENAGAYGFYWSSSLSAGYPGYALSVYFLSDFFDWGLTVIRYCGQSVRPVSGESTLVTSVTLSQSSLTLNEGESAVLTATVWPSTAVNKSVSWSSSNTSVATVTSAGKVTAVRAGSAVITVTTSDGGYTAQCEVTVLETSGPEAVDLGLGVKWASCNVGATSPEEYGDYFAWGETEPKSNYSWSTYKWCNGAYNKLTKYCNKSNYWYGSGSMYNKTVLDLSDDAARANWGGSWRMPTDAEWTELRTKCTWTWTTQNGKNGYKVTGPKTGNSIFLPAAGGRSNASLSNAGAYGFYWSSSLDTWDPSYACSVLFDSDDYYWNNDGRYFGFSVRPVSE